MEKSLELRIKLDYLESGHLTIVSYGGTNYSSASGTSSVTLNSDEICILFDFLKELPFDKEQK